ncbi:methyltransferase-like protein 22 isoform X2 [Bufo gargarizans]|uniref:methyltransferase-like protein 22 isoform X2 n=1 Tax=Bufo gargarizans TaxID=30331 RepID=UPI001CF4A483|nr:methyltransferase-like protein 22 isoform X2 [Bufo gargarizans]
MTSSQRARSAQCVPGLCSRRPELRPSHETQEQKHASQKQQTEMEVVTFSKDTVLSDIHLRIQHKRQLMVRLNTVGQPVFQTEFKIFLGNNLLETASNKEEISVDDDTESLLSRETTPHEEQKLETLLDDDGDLEVQRRPASPSDRHVSSPCIRDVVYPTILTLGSEDYKEEASSNDEGVVKIEHTMATPLEDVGKQIWRGAFLLADYILWQQDLFRGCTALELGAGTGFTSIIMATVAKAVYCTGGQVKVKELDWLKNQFCTDPEAPYSWTDDDIADLYDQTTVILAADVFYDDDLTDALFKTLDRITHAVTRLCTIYLSIERRFNFTLRYMDITCDAYNHFRNCLNNFEKIKNGKLKWTATEIKPAFPQFFSYEREHLELWKITATTLT